ncbi:MAG TPA: RND transporter [Rhizobiales bacterium]|jgi:predicted RND superfamily exporter protein|nr:RND transporter [Hyphomicrobiales bacterium]HCL61044.1 RND transporter [Hyphomicrobiales bacterium]
MQQKTEPRRVRSLSFGIERLGLLALRYPVVVATILAAVTVAALFGITKLRVDDSLSELFRTDAPEFHDYETISERFPSSEYDVLIVVSGNDLLERKSIQALRNLVINLQFVDGMAGEVSLFSAREAPEAGKVPGPVFPAALPKGEAYKDLIDKVRRNEIISGKLLSDDGTLTLILLALDRQVVESKGLNSVVQQIHDTAEENLKDTTLKMQLSGAPVMQLEIRNAVEHDRNLYNALGFLFGAVIAYAFFRRFSLMLIAALPPVIAIVWSLGLFGWLGFKLNLFLNVMIPLIMVLGFSDSMQLTVAMRNRLLEGDRRIKAARYAVLVVGPACVLATATAAASFIALLFSQSALIRTFGIAGALSTAIAFVVGISLVPLLTRSLIPRNAKAYAANLKSHDRAMNALKRFCGKIAEFGVRYPHIVVALGLLVVIGFGAIYVTLPPRYRLADQVPDREQAVAASAQLDEKLTGANPLHVMIDYPQGKTLYDPHVLQAISDVHAIVEKQPGVGNVWSIETLRRWLAKTQEDTPEKLQEYVSILPDYLVDRFIDEKDNSVVVTGRIPDIDVSDLLPVIEKLDADLNAVRKAYPDYRIVVTGLSAIAARNSATMIGKLNAGLTTEIVFICIFLGFAFRSVMVSVVTVLPTLFPVFTAGAVLAASGEGLQFASIVALIVAFGLSLNAAVHYLNRLRLEDRPGEDPAIGVERATVLIGPALVLTSLILAFGLGITVLSALPSLRLFGKLSALTLVAALVGDLLLLPASVLLYRRFVGRLIKKRGHARTA